MLRRLWSSAIQSGSAHTRLRRITGFSVDRRRIYSVGGILPLSLKDPCSKERPLVYRTDEWVTHDEIQAFLETAMPDGMSRHGWDYMTAVQDYVLHQPNQQHYIRNLPQIEIVCELVRRSHFPNLPSRLQSYFAFLKKEEAVKFSRNQPPQEKPLGIYELSSDKALIADQEWLKLGYSPAMSWLMAYKYWSGAVSKTPIFEVILGPPVKVIRRIE